MDHVINSAIEWEPPLEGLVLKYSFRNSGYDITAGNLFIYEHSETNTISFQYTLNNLKLGYEYSVTRQTEKIDIPALNYHFGQHFDMAAFYGEIAYSFTEWFEAGCYYAEFWPNKDDKDGSNQVAKGFPASNQWLKEKCLALKFNINDFWSIKCEGHFMNGTAGMYMHIQDKNPDNSWDVEENDWFLGAVKATFSF